jgi:hypothetical protein
MFEGECVGYRSYDDQGRLQIETPVKHGKKHGREFIWDDDGSILSMEPYREGKCHGTAKQYGPDGRVIGTYQMVHGTGMIFGAKGASPTPLTTCVKYILCEMGCCMDLPGGYTMMRNPSGMKNIGTKESLTASTVSGILKGNSGAAIRSTGSAARL